MIECLQVRPWFVVTLMCARRWKSAALPGAVASLDGDEVMTLTPTEGHSGSVGGARITAGIWPQNQAFIN